MKKTIVVLALLAFACNKESKTPEPAPLPVKVLKKQKVGVMYQNGCPNYTVTLKLNYAGKDTLLNNKTFWAFFEDSITAETIKIEPGGVTCMTYSVSVWVNDVASKTYTVIFPPITHTLQ